MRRAILTSVVFMWVVFPAFTFAQTPSFVTLDEKNVLVQCLNEKKFKMYGKKDCSACAIQKEYFGDSFVNVSYTDCLDNKDLCEQKGIRAFPTWEDASGKTYRGAIPLATLAELSLCSGIEASVTPAATSSSTASEYMPLVSRQEAIIAFLSGLISFFAPCLLPLFPVYISVITGFTFTELYGLSFEKIRGRIFISSLFFVLGFSFVYVILGVTGSVIGQLLGVYLPILLKVSGVFLILLGLLQLGVVHINAFRFDYAWRVQKKLTRFGYITAIATGIASALSWIPCVGPLLSPILLLSAKSESAARGALLLFIYSLGLTLPFLLAGFSFSSFVRQVQSHKTFFHRISQVAGIFMILFGMLLLLDMYAGYIGLYNTGRRTIETMISSWYLSL